MKSLLFGIIIAFSFGASAQANQHSELVDISGEFATESFENATGKAQQLFCNSRFKPAGIQVTVGVLTVSWKTEDLCKGYVKP